LNHEKKAKPKGTMRFHSTKYNNKKRTQDISSALISFKFFLLACLFELKKNNFKVFDKYFFNLLLKIGEKIGIR